MHETAANTADPAPMDTWLRNGHKNRPVLITGGAGFIGTNLADRILSHGRPVLVFDNLSRAGVEKNLDWLVKKHGNLVQFEISDIRNRNALSKAVRQSSRVFHFAAQVAVTTSLDDPVADFEVNALGTLNLLEALREYGDESRPLVFTSTNKVYGALEDVPLKINGNRYVPEDDGVRKHGIGEKRPVNFHSPYGCSKGSADQYVLDYAGTFGLPATVFRMSCIYGEHQFGTEDQGWVAHFLIQALESKPIVLYGDGMQVRDVLYVDDLVNALITASTKVEKISGEAFNIGGGTLNSISLIELLDLISDLQGEPCEIEFADWRPADQRYYVSDTAKFQQATGWKQQWSLQDGVERLYSWLHANRGASSAEAAAGNSAGVVLQRASERSDRAGRYGS